MPKQRLNGSRPRVEVFEGTDGRFYYEMFPARGNPVLDARPNGYTRRWTARRQASRDFPGVVILDA